MSAEDVLYTERLRRSQADGIVMLRREAPLAELAADFGCSLQRLDLNEAPPVLTAASDALREVSDVLRVISSAVADGRATPEERLRMKQEARELVVALARLEMSLDADSTNNSAGPGAVNSPGLQKGSER